MISNGVLLEMFLTQADKSAKLDREATKKNIKAFTKIADANARLEKCQSDLLNQLQINAKRKNGFCDRRHAIASRNETSILIHCV